LFAFLWFMGQKMMESRTAGIRAGLGRHCCRRRPDATTYTTADRVCKARRSQTGMCSVSICCRATSLSTSCDSGTPADRAWQQLDQWQQVGPVDHHHAWAMPTHGVDWRLPGVAVDLLACPAARPA